MQPTNSVYQYLNLFEVDSYESFNASLCDATDYVIEKVKSTPQATYSQDLSFIIQQVGEKIFSPDNQSYIDRTIQEGKSAIEWLTCVEKIFQDKKIPTNEVSILLNKVRDEVLMTAE